VYFKVIQYKTKPNESTETKTKPQSGCPEVLFRFGLGLDPVLGLVVLFFNLNLHFLASLKPFFGTNHNKLLLYKFLYLGNRTPPILESCQNTQACSAV